MHHHHHHEPHTHPAERPVETRAVRVNKSRLVAQLQENRERHQREYQEALAGYRVQLVAALTRKLERAKRKEDVSHDIELERPADRTDDYDRALAILEWEEQETLELPLVDFERWVLDAWPWRAGFRALHGSYTHGATSRE
jgi:hypothetical protein